MNDRNQRRTFSRSDASACSGCSEPIGRFEILLPDDPRWQRKQFEDAQRRAAALSAHGWRLLRQTGPRGTYYDGHGPKGARIMSDSDPDERAAFMKAINHAWRVQFP